MDPSVLAALARWPQVPAVHGWLGLDRRGRWRLQDEPIRHTGLAHFISRNYAATEAGEWYFQNGPQRVFVSLAYTPWVLHWRPERGFSRHTGAPADGPHGAWLDEEGNLLIGFEGGVGLVCDLDLPGLAARFSARPEPGAQDATGALEAFLAAPGSRPLWLHLPTGPLPVAPIRACEVPTRFGFDPAPQPRP